MLNPYESPKSTDQEEAESQAVDAPKRIDSAYALAFNGLLLCAILMVLGAWLLSLTRWPIAQL